MFKMLVSGTILKYTTDKDLPTCVRGHAKDLTIVLRTVVVDVVYMYE